MTEQEKADIYLKHIMATNQALLYGVTHFEELQRNRKAVDNCPFVKWEQDMQMRIPMCKLTRRECDQKCERN